MKVLFELRTRGLTSHGLTLQEFGMSENRLTKYQKTNREREARMGWGEGRGKDREIGKRGRKGAKALENVS